MEGLEDLEERVEDTDATFLVSGLPDLTATADPTVTDGLRPRRIQVKLTSERLMSEKGLPWVLKNGPKRIRISRRKRSTYENLNHIIQFYQLWAHELFPKAKFKDFIKLCQALGKNDKMLRQFREDVFRREMWGDSLHGETDGIEPPNDEDVVPGEDFSTDLNNADEESQNKYPDEHIPNGNQNEISKSSHDALDQFFEDDIYSLSTRNKEPTDEEQLQVQQDSLLRMEDNESFAEDEEALEAMKDLGF